MALPATPAVRQQMRLDEMPRLDRNSRQIQIWPCYCQSSLQQLQGTGLGALTTASLKRWVPIAVDRAIREIIQPVVERSGALQRKLLQGLCNGSDGGKMRKAGQLMVANLAVMPLVTCREPLRASVSTFATAANQDAPTSWVNKAECDRTVCSDMCY
jgi:hypothetical protein